MPTINQLIRKGPHEQALEDQVSGTSKLPSAPRCLHPRLHHDS